MDHIKQIQAFQRDLTAVVDRYRAEFELPMASAVGTLEVIKAILLAEAIAPDEEEGE